MNDDSQYNQEQQAISVLAGRLKVLQQEEADWKSQLDEAARQVQRIKDQADALIRTIRLLDPAWGSEATASESLDVQRFRAVTIPEIAAEIAKENRGDIPTSRLADILLKVGRAQAYRNAYASAFSALTRSPRFVKVAKGQFRLVGEGGSNGE
jgi:hypothetical protein